MPLSICDFKSTSDTKYDCVHGKSQCSCGLYRSIILHRWSRRNVFLCIFPQQLPFRLSVHFRFTWLWARWFLFFDCHSFIFLSSSLVYFHKPSSGLVILSALDVFRVFINMIRIVCAAYAADMHNRSRWIFNNKINWTILVCVAAALTVRRSQCLINKGNSERWVWWCTPRYKSANDFSPKSFFSL